MYHKRYAYLLSTHAKHANNLIAKLLKIFWHVLLTKRNSNTSHCDLLIVLIELSSLTATAKALPAEICQGRFFAIDRRSGSFEKTATVGDLEVGKF